MKYVTEKIASKKSHPFLTLMLLCMIVVNHALNIARAEGTSVQPQAAAQIAASGDAPSWSTTGNLNVARSDHTATLLSNGKVLVAGGVDIYRTLSSAELYDPDTGTWTTTGNLNVARSDHTATLLPNGKVLVAGGVDYARGVDFYDTLSSAELYNPDTGTWTTTGGLNTARQLHTATLLRNGMVLAAGGLTTFFDLGFQVTDSLELYDTDAGTWSTISHLITLRGLHTATVLEDGRVLFAGGFDGDESPSLGRSELYDPATRTESGIGPLNAGRGQHAATLLATGQALVAGGLSTEFSGQGFGFNAARSAELFDPVTGRWSVTGRLGTARRYHTATLLASGKVLVAGGSSTFPSEIPTDSVELYDPTTGMWSATNSLSTARYHHTATLLPNGKALVAGGSITNGTLNSAELYDPATAAILVPRITSASVAAKKLFIFGENFDDGAVILLNGEEQKTRNDDENPKTTLIGKRAGKKIKPGDTLQVRNPNGTISQEFAFTG